VNRVANQFRLVRRRRAAVVSGRSPLARGVTLMELMVAMLILSILAAAVIGATAAAMESARVAKTKTMIAKIHTLLMERWESYETRRADINPNLLRLLDNAVASGALGLAERGQIRADLELLARRELMQVEMPDRWSDVLGALPGDPTPSVPRALASYPALRNIYLRRFDAAQAAAPNGAAVIDNQEAECLYLTVMYATGDGEARTLFSELDVGDVDGDGAPEFLDGWGRPIRYLRWPAGFVGAGLSALCSGDADADHDPYDPFRRDDDAPIAPPALNRYPGALAGLAAPLKDDSRAARLLPLVYSDGPDNDGDLFLANEALIADPYVAYSSQGITARIGAPMRDLVEQGIDPSNDGGNWVDNLHNHLID
jgi:prepilin-type N-terminal cleavage/methylation domain-containing protein